MWRSPIESLLAVAWAGACGVLPGFCHSAFAWDVDLPVGVRGDVVACRAYPSIGSAGMGVEIEGVRWLYSLCECGVEGRGSKDSIGAWVRGASIGLKPRKL